MGDIKAWQPHECDEDHEGHCSECCRLAGPCHGCLDCDGCRGGLRHMWQVLLSTSDHEFAEAERRALVALARVAHR